MKYRGFKIEKSGEVYIVRKPSGEKAWAEPAINRATAKRWIDAHLAECAARNYTPERVAFTAARQGVEAAEAELNSAIIAIEMIDLTNEK